MWHDLLGPIVRQSGTSGTCTLPAGAKLLHLRAFASAAASIQIFDDADAVTLPANSGWFELDELHTATVVPKAAPTIVFTSTASYFVEYTTAGLS